MANNYYLNKSAKDAYRSYILAYNSHSMKDIFNVHCLDMQVLVFRPICKVQSSIFSYHPAVRLYYVMIVSFSIFFTSLVHFLTVDLAGGCCIFLLFQPTQSELEYRQQRLKVSEEDAESRRKATRIQQQQSLW